MAIITIRDPKTGAIRRQVDTRTNTFVSTGTSSPPPSSQQTSIRVISDSPADVGKTFAGQRIEQPRASDPSPRRSSGTVVRIESDSATDQARGIAAPRPLPKETTLREVGRTLDSNLNQRAKREQIARQLRVQQGFDPTVSRTISNEIVNEYERQRRQQVVRQGLENIRDRRSKESEVKARQERLKEVEKAIKDRLSSVKNIDQFISKDTQKALISGKALTNQQQIEVIPALLLQGAGKGIGVLYRNLNVGKLAGNVIQDTQTYSRGLSARIKAGETNPLASDLKKLKNVSPTKIGTGALKEFGDIINFALGVRGVTIDSRGNSYDGIIASGLRPLVEYSVAVTKAYQNQVGEQKLKQDLKSFVDSTKAISKGTVDVIDFARQYPLQTSFIVGGAISAGVISSKNNFLKNPNENVGRAIVWLFPRTIIRGVTKGAQALGKAGTTILNSKASKAIGTQLATDVKDTVNILRKSPKDFSKGLSSSLSKTLEKRLEPIIQRTSKALVDLNKARTKPQAIRNANIIRSSKNKAEKVIAEVLPAKEAASIQERFFGRKQIPSKALKISIRNLQKNTNILNTTSGRFTNNQAIKLKKEFNRLIGVDVVRVVKDPKNNLFKLESSESIKILLRKGLMPTNEDIVQALLLARKEGGQSFSQLKKLIKKRLGLDVQQKTTKDAITFRLIDPKTKQKTVLKSKKQKGRVKKIDIQEKKLGDVNPSLNKKLAKKLKDDEFFKSQASIQAAEKEMIKLGKELENTFGAGVIDDLQKGTVKATKGFFADKKGRATFTTNSRNYYNKQKKKTNNIKQAFSKRKGSYKKEVKENNNFIKKANNKIEQLKRKERAKPLKDRNQTRLNKSLNRIREQQRAKARNIRTLNTQTRKELNKIRNTISNQISELNASITLIKTARTLGLLSAIQLKTLLGFANTNIQDLRNQQAKINEFKFDIPAKTPPTRTPPTRTTRQPPRSPPRRTPPKTPTKMSKARVIKLTQPKTPKVLRIPRVDLNAPKKGSRQGYIIQVKEGNRIVSKSTTPLPLNRAKRLGKRRVDNTLAASFDLVPKGKTPITDINSAPLGEKFRTRRGKDPKVRRFVEKKRFRLDSPTEKRELQRRRKAAKAKLNKKTKTKNNKRSKK